MSDCEFTTIEDIYVAAERAGSHWFSAATLRLFGSHVNSAVYPFEGGAYFVTSEKGPPGGHEPRKYTVRVAYVEPFSIATSGRFREFISRSTAHRAAKRRAQNWGGDV